MGSGQQWVSWIHREDLVRLILESIKDDNYNGKMFMNTPYMMLQERIMPQRLRLFVWESFAMRWEMQWDVQTGYPFQKLLLRLF